MNTESEKSNIHPFIEYLQSQGWIDIERSLQLEAIIKEKSGSPLTIAARTGMVPSQVLFDALCQYTGWPSISGSELHSMAPRIQEALFNLRLQAEWCQKENIILWENDDGIVCCTTDLISRTSNEMLRIQGVQNHKKISMRACRQVDLDNFYADIALHRQLENNNVNNLTHLRELAEEGPIVELVNSLLSQSVTRRASDIHVEPGENGFITRVRVDGIMRELQRFPMEKFDATVCRIKILSQLDIAERRLPQDGRMTARIHGEVFDVRVSILPGSNGESVVMRLLRQDRPDYNLEDLGMLPDHTNLFQRWIHTPDGIILVTGPTGSGKTTTLYTALDLGNDGLKKIITVEDPVEYKLDGITQIQVNSDIGFTFAASLRSILRHDPDVILIGEIRDQETASIAVQSALTGHLVFSTLHTNSAAGAITRLADMGIERFLLASSLRGIMAQRLVRRLCPHCRKEVENPDEIHLELIKKTQNKYSSSLVEPKICHPVGCDICLHTGFLGRIAVYEMFEVDADMRLQILNAVSEEQTIQRLRSLGIRSMTQDGILKVAQGITTMEEIMPLGDF